MDWENTLYVKACDFAVENMLLGEGKERGE